MDQASLVVQTVKNLQFNRPQFDPWVGKIPWRRDWLPTPVFFLGESHGQSSLAGHSARVCRQSDTTEQRAARGPEPPCCGQTSAFCP